MPDKRHLNNSIGATRRRSLTYVVAGLRASGTASDLRRLRTSFYTARNRRSFRPTPTNLTKRLRLVVHVPTYPPLGFGGSEWSIRATVEYLHREGHHVDVYVDAPTKPFIQSGIHIQNRPSRRALRSAYKSADIVLSQKASGITASLLATKLGIPFVFFVRDIADWHSLPRRPDLLVFNAAWQRDMFRYEGPSIVVHPAVENHQYGVERGKYVTLINLHDSKGGSMFMELVKRMPDLTFMGVTGVWAEDEVDMPSPLPRNLIIMPATDDVRRVYRRTRLLLVPSKRETFGRVALEAAASGIPIIASPNPGTLEAMGNAATYAALSEPHEWETAIRALDDPFLYQQKSQAARHRAIQFGGVNEFASLEIELQSLRLRSAQKHL